MSRVKYLLNGDVRAVNDDVKELVYADESKYNNRPPEGELPSMGEELETCGSDYHNFCSSCGKPEVVGQCCKRAECSRCWAKWCVERATKIVSKMEERRKEIAYRRSGHSPKFHHVVLSFPEIEFASDDPEQSMFELCKSLLGQLGTFGGVLLYHPYRGSEGDDKGAWKGRIGEDTEWDEVRSELKHSEHVHAMVVADSIDKMACKALYEKTGISIHRVEKDDSNVSIYGLTDLASTTTYSLSHTLVEGDRASLRYFGSVAQTSADETTEAQANAEVRSVSGRVLGVSFSDLSCTSDADSDHDHDHDYESGQTGDTDDSEPSASASEEADYCGGRLLDIHDAPKFIQNDEWVSEAEYSGELRAVWQEYKVGDKPPPG